LIKGILFSFHAQNPQKTGRFTLRNGLRPLNGHSVAYDFHLEGGYSMVAEAMIKIQRPP
jgi:hypothetical protein